jgi:hypothetical protein
MFWTLRGLFRLFMYLEGCFGKVWMKEQHSFFEQCPYYNSHIHTARREPCNINICTWYSIIHLHPFIISSNNYV